jgi:endogenous inhibitor of DNA gyrase (YacG/DUF329 family)
LDLGAWADEKYRVPIEIQNEQNPDSVNEFSPDDAKSTMDKPPEHLLN